jgi:hypothetical protein
VVAVARLLLRLGRQGASAYRRPLFYIVRNGSRVEHRIGYPRQCPESIMMMRQAPTSPEIPASLALTSHRRRAASASMLAREEATGLLS